MSFIQLQREPGLHYLARHVNFRTSPAFEHLFEANCAIRTITPAGDTESFLHVPLSDFATFPTGSLFGHTKASILRNRQRRRVRQRIELADDFETWRIARKTRIKAKKLSGPYELAVDQDEKVFINSSNDDGVLGLAHGEQFRFICSGLSFLLDTLSLRSISAEKSLASMFVDEAETGIDENGVYVITPLRPFQNATATLQIALLLTSPELGDFVRMFFRTIGKALRGEGSGPHKAFTFREAMDCTIETEPLVINSECGEHRKVAYCDRIIADHRKPPFKEIVVRIRNTRADDQIELIEELRTQEEREKLRIASSTKVKRYPTNKRRVRLGRMDGEFGRLFPEFAKLDLRFDRKTTKTDEKRPARLKFLDKPVTNDFVTPVVSPQPPESEGKVAGVESGPVETSIFERPQLASSFLAQADEPGLEARVAKLDEVNLLMREFFLAGYYMTDHRCPRSLPDYDLGRGEEVLYQLPASWGGFAAPDKDGLLRYAAAVPLAFDHGVVWAIEILRNDPEREAFAMGLVAQLDRDDGLCFLGRVLRSVCDRVGRRRDGAPAGTFPRADFLDTRIDTVVHKQTVWDAQTLAQLIPARAELLLSPERNF
ncbi:MAG: hypothetical protein AAGJ50_10040 [Pseudomonadota bacterium]